MRRRVLRDLGTIVGVIVVLAGIVLFNGWMQRGGLTEHYTKLRQEAEKSQQAAKLEILNWDLIQKTKGTRHSGPTFDPKLVELEGKSINLVGYMVPIQDFRGMKEFMVLPVPIECYFCQSPPMRDVVYVQMAEGTTADLMKDPALLSGTLTLNKGAGTKFFYVIKDAEVGAGKKGGKMKKKTLNQEHQMHLQGAAQAEQEQKTPLLPGEKPPAPDAAPAAPAAPAPAPAP